MPTESIIALVCTVLFVVWAFVAIILEEDKKPDHTNK